jgi:hypothetical protein
MVVDPDLALNLERNPRISVYEIKPIFTEQHQWLVEQIAIHRVDDSRCTVVWISSFALRPLFLTERNSFAVKELGNLNQRPRRELL